MSASDLKRKRGRMLSNLTRVRRRALVVIENRGSRTQLVDMLKELDAALESLEEVNEELKEAIAEGSGH